jgi:ankyrin repeat protein
MEIMPRILIAYDPACINARDAYGRTPSFRASQGHHFKDGSVLRLLLEQGADISTRNQTGLTPLHVASMNKALEVSSSQGTCLCVRKTARVPPARGASGEAKCLEGVLRSRKEVVC